MDPTSFAASSRTPDTMASPTPDPSRRSRLWGDRRAVAAVEFAVVLPLMLLIYVGASELAQAVMTGRKIVTVSSTIAEIASQQPTSTQATSYPAPIDATPPSKLATIMTAATALMAPLVTTPLTMTLSAVDIVNTSGGQCCSVKVRWSYTQGGTRRPCDGQLSPVSPSAPATPDTISSAMIPAATTPLSSPQSVLISDVSYVYQPVFSPEWLTFPPMSRTTYLIPRGGGQVIVSGTMPTGTTQSGQICY